MLSLSIKRITTIALTGFILSAFNVTLNNAAHKAFAGEKLKKEAESRLQYINLDFCKKFNDELLIKYIYLLDFSVVR